MCMLSIETQIQGRARRDKASGANPISSARVPHVSAVRVQAGRASIRSRTAVSRASGLVRT